MNREKSSSKLTSRNILKIKSTICQAMGRANKSLDRDIKSVRQQGFKKRSSSTKSLAGYNGRIKTQEGKSYSTKNIFNNIISVQSQSIHQLEKNKNNSEFGWFHTLNRNITFTYQNSSKKNYIIQSTTKQQGYQHIYESTILTIQGNKHSLGSKVTNYAILLKNGQYLSKNQLIQKKDFFFNIDKKQWKMMIFSSIPPIIPKFAVKNILQQIAQLYQPKKVNANQALKVLCRKLQIDVKKKNYKIKEGFYALLILNEGFYKQSTPAKKLIQILHAKLKV